MPEPVARPAFTLARSNASAAGSNYEVVDARHRLRESDGAIQVTLAVTTSGSLSTA